MKTLRVDGLIHTPKRYVNDSGTAMCYEDFGVILSGGVAALLRGRNPFDQEASQLVLVCGLHRLATLAGVKMVEDLSFREYILKDREFKLPSGNSIGVL